jgi:large subunit ribosomal protein L24
MRGTGMHVKKGDTVLVLTGDDRGKRGRVLKTIPDKNRVIVEGINFITRHMRPSPRNPKGGRVTKEAPIHASNVKVVSEG